MRPRKRYNIALHVFLLLPLVIPCPAYDQEEPFIVVINPCSGRFHEQMKDWRMPFTRHAIREWGASRGLVLMDDAEPVVDETAAFVEPSGSSILINGLLREKRYRVWIDFVRFRKGGRLPDSLLKITADAPGTEARLIDTVRHGDIGGSYYCVDIPAAVAARGSARIRFEEVSAAPGNWGVWDIIVTGEGKLPRRSEIPGEEGIDLEINDRIVQ